MPASPEDLRYPGLDHSYTWAGEWLETGKTLPPLRNYLDPKGLAKKRKVERLSDLSPRQKSLWDDVGPR